MLSTVSQKTSDAFYHQPTNNIADDSLPQIQEKEKPTGQLWEKISDFCKLFFKTFGITTSIVLAVVPSWTLIASTKDMYDFIKVGFVGALVTTAVQMLWSKFEKANKQNISKEEEWLEKFEKRHKITLYSQERVGSKIVRPPPTPETMHYQPRVEDLNLSTAVHDDPQEIREFGDFFPNGEELGFKDDELLAFLLDEKDYCNYQLSCFESLVEEEEREALAKTAGESYSKLDHLARQKIARDYYEGLPEETKEKLVIQYLMDKIGVVLAHYNLKRKSKNTSVENSEQRVGDTKIQAKTLKAMQIAAKVCKEVGSLGNIFNFWDGSVLKALYIKYHDAISSVKNLVDIWICIAEYSCVYSRRDEIKAIHSDIQALRERKEKLDKVLNSTSLKEETRGHYCKRIQFSINAIEASIDTLKLRKKELEEKNKLKLVEIMFDLFEAALSGSQDLLELLKTKTTLFKDLPKLLEMMVYVDKGMNVFCSLVSLVFNIRKICVTNNKAVNLLTTQEYCIKKLQEYREQETQEDDGYALFLSFKIDALETSQKKRWISFWEKAVKILDDTFSSVKYTQILLIALGISVGVSSSGVIAAGATLFSLGSLGFSIYRFCYYDIYLQRHQFMYKVNVIWLRYVRAPQYRTMLKYERKLDKSSKEKSQLKQHINIQKATLRQIVSDVKKEIKEKIKNLEQLSQLQNEEINALENLENLSEAKKYHYQHLKNEKNATDSALNSLKEKVSAYTKTKILENLFEITENKEIVDYYHQIHAYKMANEKQLEIKKVKHEDLKDKTRTYIAIYRETIEAIQNNEKERSSNDSAARLSKYTKQSVDKFKQVLEVELSDPIKKAEWGRKLRQLGYHMTVTPLDPELVVSLAVSTKQLPVVKSSLA